MLNKIRRIYLLLYSLQIPFIALLASSRPSAAASLSTLSTGDAVTSSVSSSTSLRSYAVVFATGVEDETISAHWAFMSRLKVFNRIPDNNHTLPYIRHRFEAIFQGYSRRFTPEVAAEILAQPEVSDVVELSEWPAVEAHTSVSTVGDPLDGRTDGQFNRGVRELPVQEELEIIITPDSGWNAVRISHREHVGMYSRGDWVHTQYLGQGVTVYMFDSGVDADHPGFAGYDLSRGPNFARTSSMEDKSEHGTFCTSTVTGIKGLAPGSSVVAVKVLDDVGNSQEDDLFAAVDYVLKQPGDPRMKIINFSSFSYTRPGKFELFPKVIENTIRKGVHFVTLAGNDGRDACETKLANVPGAILVGSINGFNRLPNQEDGDMLDSNRGECVTLFAPGSWVPVLSAGIHDLRQNRVGAGTSVAAPQVAAVLAARLSEVGPMAPMEAKEWLGGVASRGQVENGNGDELILFNGVELQ